MRIFHCSVPSNFSDIGSNKIFRSHILASSTVRSTSIFLIRLIVYSRSLLIFWLSRSNNHSLFLRVCNFIFYSSPDTSTSLVPFHLQQEHTLYLRQKTRIKTMGVNNEPTKNLTSLFNHILLNSNLVCYMEQYVPNGIKTKVGSSTNSTGFIPNHTSQKRTKENIRKELPFLSG